MYYISKSACDWSGRKVFRPTDQGRAVLAEHGPRWIAFAESSIAVVRRGVTP